MALDLGLTTRQLLPALDGLALASRTRGQRLDAAIDRALTLPADQATFRTAAVGRRPYSSARTGPEGSLGSRPPPRFPPTGSRCPWTAPTSMWIAPTPPRRPCSLSARLLIPDPGPAPAPFAHTISAALVHTYSQ